MHACIAMDPEAEALLGVFIEDAIPEFHDIFLKGFIARWVIEDLSDDSGVTRP